MVVADDTQVDAVVRRMVREDALIALETLHDVVAAPFVAQQLQLP